jgi:4-amino-4-deoxychorismate lyase
MTRGGARLRVNGEDSRQVDATDRGLQYGDGLFETIAVVGGTPRLHAAHLERLLRGCARLDIGPVAESLIEEDVAAVSGPGDSVVKLIVTRGPSGRGYRPPRGCSPTRVAAGFDVEPGAFASALPGLRVRTCRTRLGRNPALAGLKHLCRLEQVIARGEWQDDAVGEGLMLDEGGHVVCGTQSNLFVVKDGRLITPSVALAGVEGVMRRTVLEWAGSSGIDVAVQDLHAKGFDEVEEVFVTNALWGARAVLELDGRQLRLGEVAWRFMQWLGEA